MDKPFLDLGRNIDDWHRSGRVKFLFDKDNKNLHSEIERILDLIFYVQGKQREAKGDKTY